MNGTRLLRVTWKDEDAISTSLRHIDYYVSTTDGEVHTLEIDMDGHAIHQIERWLDLDANVKAYEWLS